MSFPFVMAVYVQRGCNQNRVHFIQTNEFFAIRFCFSYGYAETQEHLDPSEIISLPFPLVNSTIFAILPVFVLMIVWTVYNPSTVGWKILSLIKVTGFIFVIFGLCGNDLIATWEHSVLAALFLAALLCTNLTEKRTSKLLEELPFYDHSDLLSTIRLYTTLAFIIPFSILSVLDHGDQKQRWPCPVFMGGTYGFAFGSVGGIFLNYFKAKKLEKVKN